MHNKYCVWSHVCEFISHAVHLSSFMGSFCRFGGAFFTFTRFSVLGYTIFPTTTTTTTLSVRWCLFVCLRIASGICISRPSPDRPSSKFAHAVRVPIEQQVSTRFLTPPVPISPLRLLRVIRVLTATDSTTFRQHPAPAYKVAASLWKTYREKVTG